LKPNAESGGEDKLLRHTGGDEHADRGFEYERAWRCLWLLALRGTGDALAVAEGEDAKLVQADGRTTYRQVKKKEGSQWGYDKRFKDFVTRAHGRFQADSSVRHEFYTNQAIPDRLRQRGHLNPGSPRVRETAPNNTEAFCDTVYLLAERHSLDDMERVVRDHLAQTIDRAYPGCQALRFITVDEITGLAARLFAVEQALWARRTAVHWVDVDAKLGLDRLIADLFVRSMADGSLVQFDGYPTVAEGGPDNAQTRAVEAMRAGKIVPRQAVETQVWELVDEWWEGAESPNRHPNRAEYLVVVLAGAHGTGKTWSLMCIGSQLTDRYDGMAVCVATGPPSAGFTLSTRAISQPGPYAILIDDSLPDWRGLLQSTRPNTLRRPVLVVVTAARPADDESARQLTHSLGARAVVVELPDHLDDRDAEVLGARRGVPLADRERRRTKETNIRHFVQLLSGVSAPEHLAEVPGLLSEPVMLDVVGPILLCASLRVPLPSGLLERSAGQVVPAALRTWVLGSGGGPEALLSFEDPGEAGSLLALALGETQQQRTKAWCEKLIGHVDPQQGVDRTFVRRLLSRLAHENLAMCSKLIASCASSVDAVVAQEPLWALVFLWLPILVGAQREEVLTLALAKASTSPTTLAEIGLLVEAYGSREARAYLGAWFRRLVRRDSWALSRFVAGVKILEKDDQRGLGTKLTGLLVELPMEAFAETLNQHNCFQEATSLASDFGEPNDRWLFLHRILAMIDERLASGREPKQKWFEAALHLSKRVVMQGRSGCALEITRKGILGGNLSFEAERYYDTSFEEEQSLAHRPLIKLGLRLMQGHKPDGEGSIPPVLGNLLDFAASWGGEDEWASVADPFLKVLESLSAVDLAFDRVSHVVLPAFSAMRRGPGDRRRRFLKAAVVWMPVEGRVPTMETAKLVLSVIGFVAAQTDVEERLNAMARQVLSRLIDSRDPGPLIATFMATLRMELGMPKLRARQVLLLDKWVEHPTLAEIYLVQVARIRWDESERKPLAERAVATWGGNAKTRQSLTHALIHLEDLAGASEYGSLLADETPGYPDPWGYLAIIAAKRGDWPEARNCLAETEKVHEESGRRLHPYLAAWIHRELAGTSSGRLRTMHLLCAELCRDRPLRPRNEVLAHARESYAS